MVFTPPWFPRYRGTETLEVITAFGVIASCKMLRLNNIQTSLILYSA